MMITNTVKNRFRVDDLSASTGREARQADQDSALDRLVDMYPLAFALASASTFRTGVDLRQWANARQTPPPHPGANKCEVM